METVKIDITKSLPYDKKFFSLVDAFVFNCPAATVVSKKKTKTKLSSGEAHEDLYCSGRVLSLRGGRCVQLDPQSDRAVSAA